MLEEKKHTTDLLGLVEGRWLDDPFSFN